MFDNLMLILIVIIVANRILFFFFFNDTAPTEIYTLSLHDALPTSPDPARRPAPASADPPPWAPRDRKSTRLNSSHPSISYAVFCLKKKKNTHRQQLIQYERLIINRRYVPWP